MSGRKDIIQPFQTIVDGYMAVDVISTPTNVQYIDRISVLIDFTGTPVGSFFIETSLNYKPPLTDAVDNATWVALDLSPAPIAAGVADSIYIDITQTSAPWIRVKYEATSSDGYCQAWISGKMS
mgnify:CR=1 FL=1|tara:strand:- start:264 stop:635 length:372 start_codon:yes stop_codon:yes gene_type:complete